MSYDLYFYKRRDNPLTEEDIATYLTNTLPFNKSDYARQWDYENPETGVYFLIEWNEEDEESESFDEFISLNFSFSLNFFRPHFFGLESFPIVNKIIKELDLFVLNPQDTTEPLLPQEYPKEHFQKEWTRHNDQLSLQQFDELKFKYLTLEKANYMWWYQTHKEELQNSLTEDIYVPGIFLLESKNDGQLYTVCVWPQHIPIILPPVDYVIVKKVYDGFFKKGEESGVVSYDTVIKDLGNSFEIFEYVVPNLLILRQNEADKLKKKFNGLKLIGPATEFGTLVSNDKFVNVQP